MRSRGLSVAAATRPIFIDDWAQADQRGWRRTYVSRLARRLDNPTVAVLEKLSKTLAAELYEVPEPQDKPPATLSSGRKK